MQEICTKFRTISLKIFFSNYFAWFLSFIVEKLSHQQSQKHFSHYSDSNVSRSSQRNPFSLRVLIKTNYLKHFPFVFFSTPLAKWAIFIFPPFLLFFFNCAWFGRKKQHTRKNVSGKRTRANDVERKNTRAHLT